MTIPVDPTESERAAYQDNILRVYAAANRDQFMRGRVWYQVAHDLAETIAGDARTGAGVIAVLSARQKWDVNVRTATKCCAGDITGHTKANLEKVRRILDGEDPENVLPVGMKTHQFYRCILDPDDPEAVVIDRHAHDVAVGRRYSEKENRGLSSAKRYGVLADAYREAAKVAGMSPSALQAIVWVVWTELKR